MLAASRTQFIESWLTHYCISTMRYVNIFTVQHNHKSQFYVTHVHMQAHTILSCIYNSYTIYNNRFTTGLLVSIPTLEGSVIVQEYSQHIVHFHCSQYNQFIICIHALRATRMELDLAYICKDTLVANSIQVQTPGSKVYVTCCFVGDLLQIHSTIDPKLKWEPANA